MYLAHRLIVKFVVAITVLVAAMSRVEPLTAQEPSLGSFGFINGVDAENPTFLKVNGRAYKVSGYKPGGATRSGRLAEGPAKFAIENAGIEGSAELAASIAPASPFILLAYVERATSKEGEVKEKLQLRKMNSRPSKEFKWSGLYLTGRNVPATIEVGGTAVTLEPMRLVPLPATGSIEVMVEGQDQAALQATPDRPAHYLVVAYDKKEGGVGLLLYVDNPVND
jgi:hypothetical protein